MPRAIGASTGVNETDTGDPLTADRFCSISGRVPVHATDAVRRGGAHHLGTEQVRFRRPCRRRTCR